jgi:hypothetical protein
VAHLFLEFSPRCRQRFLVVEKFTLWNGPGAVVFFCPIRPAWMREEHFDASTAACSFPEEQKSRALS